MDIFAGECDSASSGEDERMQRRRRCVIRTVMSTVAEADIFDASPYAPEAWRLHPWASSLAR
jgi:hypothetical protein